MHHSMLERDCCVRLPCPTAKDRLIHDVKIACSAGSLGTKLGHQRMGSHDVVIDNEVKTGELASQTRPVKLVILGDKVLAEEIGSYRPMPEFRPSRNAHSQKPDRTHQARPFEPNRARKGGFQNLPA